MSNVSSFMGERSRPLRRPKTKRSISITASQNILPQYQPRPRGIPKTESTKVMEAFDRFRQTISMSSLPILQPLGQFPQVRILISSNWSNTKTITCGSIEALEDHAKVIRVTKPWTPNRKTPPEHFTPLFDQKLFKTEPSWEDEIPEGSPYTLIFTVEASNPPKHLRFYPSKTNVDLNIREIEIFVDNEFVFRGEIMKDFITVVPIEVKQKASQIPVDPFAVSVMDKHGKVPIIPMNECTFNFLDSYDRSTEQRFVSLDEIRLFGIDGGQIPVLDLGLVHMENMGHRENAARLFYARSHPRHPFKVSWVGELKEDSNIRLQLRSSRPLAAITITNGPDKKWSTDNGVKKISIIIDGNLVWVGTIRQRLPDSTVLDQVIWLTDDRKTRALVMSKKVELDTPDVLSSVIKKSGKVDV